MATKTIEVLKPQEADELAPPEPIQLEGHRKPKIPNKWDYAERVRDIRVKLLSWRNITKPIMDELWISRKILKSKRRKEKRGIDVSRNWTDFCISLGTSSQVINRWLNQWFVQNESIEPTKTEKALMQMIEDGECNKQLYIIKTRRTYPDGEKKISHHICYQPLSNDNQTTTTEEQPSVSREEAKKHLGDESENTESTIEEDGEGL